MAKKVAVKVMINEEDLDDIIFFYYDGIIKHFPKEILKLLDKIDTNTMGVA